MTPGAANCYPVSSHPQGAPSARGRALRCAAAVALLLLLGATQRSGAEYRVALVLGEDPAAVAALREQGFLVHHNPIGTDKEVRRSIETWADTTPTLSTAVVYFSGASRDGGLAAANGRSVPVAVVCETLAERGGSARNVIVIPAGVPGAGAETADARPGDRPRDPLAGCEVVRGIPVLHGVASRALSPPDQFVLGRRAGDEWVNARGMVFCWCPAGRFTAGSPPSTPGRFADEEQREVVIGHGFWIGKFEHTRGQRLRNLSAHAIGSHKNDPVNHLHWDDGSRMLTTTLTDAERAAGRLPADWEYSLPTEEQWEYAARAGSDTRFYFGDDLQLLPRHANFADKTLYDSAHIFSNHAHRTLDDGYVQLAPVGSFLPNPWGLHDVYGNVAEWCIDLGARGGSWVSVAENCRSAFRDRYAARDDQNYLGYRFVIQPVAKQDNSP